MGPHQGIFSILPTSSASAGVIGVVELTGGCCPPPPPPSALSLLPSHRTFGNNAGSSAFLGPIPHRPMSNNALPKCTRGWPAAAAAGPSRRRISSPFCWVTTPGGDRPLTKTEGDVGQLSVFRRRENKGGGVLPMPTLRWNQQQRNSALLQLKMAKGDPENLEDLEMKKKAQQQYENDSFEGWETEETVEEYYDFGVDDEDEEEADDDYAFDVDNDGGDAFIDFEDEVNDEEEEALFLREELARLESLEDMLKEIEGDLEGEGGHRSEEEEGEEEGMDEETLLTLLGDLPEDAEPDELLALERQILGFEKNDDDEDSSEHESSQPVPPGGQRVSSVATTVATNNKTPLEQALLQGVVPADAGVGSECLPGDYGFDPLDFATKDYFQQVQTFLLGLLPGEKSNAADADDDDKEDENERGAALPKRGFLDKDTSSRPPALILRDYREAEIRHGRLAMLAAIIWPLQEILDKIFLPDTFGTTTIIYGGVTLPYLPLLMTLIMLLLGYLDVYAKTIKEIDTGEAFLPGECFWDPLAMLQGAPESMKRNMQERELANGRMAMIAVAAFAFEEATTHLPVILVPGNELLFEPWFQIPEIQSWLDSQFGQSPSSSLNFPEATDLDFVDAIKDIVD